MISEPKHVVLVASSFHVCASIMLFLLRKLKSVLQFCNVLCLRHHVMKVCKKNASHSPELGIGLGGMHISLNILSSLL